MNEFPDERPPKKIPVKPKKSQAGNVAHSFKNHGAAASSQDFSAKGATKGAANWVGVEVPSGKKKERMEHIDAALQQVRRRERSGAAEGDIELPSAVRFARELGLESARTIRRLIEEMQDLYGMPIEFIHRRHGYRYTEDVAFLPFLQFSESELVAVYLTRQLGVFQNTSFLTRLKSAFRKLAGLFGGKMSFDTALLDECFSFEPSGHYAVFHPAHLEACSRAMLRQEELVLTYTKQHGEGAGVPEKRRVRPLHITYRDFAWYVVCLDLLRGKLRNFMVTRINHLEETGVRFVRPKDFDAAAYLKRNFKTFTSGEAVKVELEFSPEAARLVMERQGHSTRRFEKLANGWVRMTMKVALTPDLEGWIGGFFGQCRVVGPMELKETMRRLHLEGAGEAAA